MKKLVLVGSLVLAVLIVALASAAHAQTVEFSADITSLNLGYVKIKPVDADGDPSTEEWLAHAHGFPPYRVIALRNGRVCVGPAFDPRPTSLDLADVETRDGRHVIIVTAPKTVNLFTVVGMSLSVVRLDIPTCQTEIPQGGAR